MLPVAMGQSSGGSMIHYVLPVLWMTSYLQTMGDMSLASVTLELPARLMCRQAARPGLCAWLGCGSLLKQQAVSP